MATIKIKGGQSSNLPESLEERELAVTLDTGELYVGTGNGKLLLNPNTENAVISVAGKTGAVLRGLHQLSVFCLQAEQVFFDHLWRGSSGVCAKKPAVSAFPCTHSF